MTRYGKRLSRLWARSRLVQRGLREIGLQPLQRKKAKVAISEFADLSAEEQVDILSELEIVKALGLADTELRFTVRSQRELSRVTRVKETWTADWVQRLPKSAVLWDVGANIGLFTLLAAENEAVDAVVAIEPSILNAESLFRNVLINHHSDKVRIVLGGLGDRTGLTDLQLQNFEHGGAFHSFKDMPEQLRPLLASMVGRQSCMLYRMDDLATLEGVPFPTHLKIDVDGFEEDVLAGGMETLSDPRLQGVQIEILDTELGYPRRASVRGIFEAHGFRQTGTIDHGKGTFADLLFVRA